MPIVRATDTTSRTITGAGTTELQRIDASPDGLNLLALKGVADVQIGTGGQGTLVLRAIDGAGNEAYRCERQVLVGGTYTISMRDDVEGFSADDGAIAATAVVLEFETSLPGQTVTQTQLVALEFQPGSGAPAMRSQQGDFQTINFPEGGAKVDEMLKNADATDLVAFHDTCGFDWTDVVEGDVWVRFMTKDAGGAYHEVFRFQDHEQYFAGGVHIDQVRPGFDHEADGSFTVDKLELWFDPGAGPGQILGVECGAFFVGAEV